MELLPWKSSTILLKQINSLSFGTPRNACTHLFTKEWLKPLLENFWPYRTNIRTVKKPSIWLMASGLDRKISSKLQVKMLFSAASAYHFKTFIICSTKALFWNFQDIAREISVPDVQTSVSTVLELKRGTPFECFLYVFF